MSDSTPSIYGPDSESNQAPAEPARSDGPDLRKHSAATAVDDHAQQATRPQRRLGWEHGGWLIAIGGFILLNQLNLPRQLWGLILFLPLVWAAALTIRDYRRTGSFGDHLWWLFGSLFAAAAGVGILLDVGINHGFVVAGGFILIGVLTALSRRN